MARQVVWTESAAADLEEVWAYIARDSKMYAATFVQRVRDVSRTLNENSERGRIFAELAMQDVREMIVGSYRMVCQVTTSTVFILRLIHGARQMPEIGKSKRT